MRRIIQLFFKSIYVAAERCISLLDTVLFRMSMWINRVEYGRHIKVIKGLPSLLVNIHAGKIRIGDNVVFNGYGDHSWNCKCKIMVRNGAELTIGNNVGMNGVMIFASNSITIEDNAKIGGGTRIFDTDHHSLDAAKRMDMSQDSKDAKSLPVVIGKDAFIGAGCFIGKGVSIGEGSIVAAGSVVVKPVPPHQVWGGNPARFIREIQA